MNELGTRAWAIAALGGMLLTGCAVGPNYLSPTPALPPSFSAANEAGAPPGLSSPSGDLSRWWRQFGDSTLSELIEEALGSNLSVALAEARLRQARATRSVAAGALWPAVSASATYERRSGPLYAAAGSPNLYQADLSAAFAIDLFGAIRRNVEAADASVEAAMEGTRDAEVSLAAQVALFYVQLRGYQQEALTARNNVAQQKKTAEITRKLYKVGFDSGLDIANAESLVATTEAQIPVFETGARQSIYTLSVLLGRSPGDLVGRLSAPGGLPSVPSEVAAGQPSDLVRRRPDVREAEAQLHAATAQIGAAEAALLPQFSIGAGANQQSGQLSQWWNTSNLSLFVGPTMTWPIFQGGAGVANVHLQEAAREEALITYRQTVLSATQDVENALTAVTHEREHHRALGEAVAADHKAVDLSLKLYTEGQTDFLNVLTAEKTLFTDELALDQSNESVAADAIALYLALGGG